jgi:hypothetical protein
VGRNLWPIDPSWWRMIRSIPLFLVLGFAVACDSKTDEKKADAKDTKAKADAKGKADAKPDSKDADAKGDTKVEAKAEDTKAAPPAAADKELDLSAWAGPFAGWVAMAPEGTKIELDDPSRQLSISETDFLSVSEAPGYADAIKSLATDKDNSNIKVVSDNEARWERNPPLGKEWNFDVKIDVGGKPWSCSGSTFTDEATADKLVAICKSMKKK